MAARRVLQAARARCDRSQIHQHHWRQARFGSQQPHRRLHRQLADRFDSCDVGKWLCIGAWNGPGIISSSVAANHGEMIGFAEASTLFTTFPATFAGQSIDNTSIVARLTAAGDTNLDGMVNTVDFTTLASHFNSADAPWSSGDLNYDGRVNAADFALLAENYGQSASASQPPDAVALLAMQTPSAAPVPAQPANIFSDDPVGDPLDRPIDSLI